jgi:septal ring factor EnvC (AmiA/AmiB activator)
MSSSNNTSELLNTIQKLAAENNNLQTQLAKSKSEIDKQKQMNVQFEVRLAHLEKHLE